MAGLTANRMTLLNRRGNKKFAQKGTDLLQAKRNALSKELQETIEAMAGMENDLETLKKAALQSFATAYALDGRGAFNFLESIMTRELGIDIEVRNIFGTSAPVLNEIVKSKIREFGTAEVSTRMSSVYQEFYDFIHLQVEYSLLWSKREKIRREIRRTNRRLNFLTHNLIPKINDEIRQIELVLESRELEDRTRQKKLKKRKSDGIR